MISTTDLQQFEIGFVAMLISLVFTLSVIGIIVVFVSYLKTKSKKFILSSIKEGKQKEASQIEPYQQVYYKEDTTFILDDEFESVLKYNVDYSSIHEEDKLSISIDRVVIGGKNNSIKTLILRFKEIYLRIFLNNNVSNSIILSDRYRFNTNIELNETFLFRIKKYNLFRTSVLIEVNATFNDNDQEFLIGSLDLDLPAELEKFPLGQENILEIPQRQIDQYYRSIGFICLFLANIHNKIKLGICATTYLDLGMDEASYENLLVYLSIEITAKGQSHKCITMMKKYSPTIVWNNVFLFEIDNENKEECMIKICLWKIYKYSIMGIEPQEKVGFVILGQDDSCTRKSQQHWQYILGHRNEEYSKWHNIAVYE